MEYQFFYSLSYYCRFIKLQATAGIVAGGASCSIQPGYKCLFENRLLNFTGSLLVLNPPITKAWLGYFAGHSISSPTCYNAPVGCSCIYFRLLFSIKFTILFCSPINNKPIKIFTTDTIILTSDGFVIPCVIFFS